MSENGSYVPQDQADRVRKALEDKISLLEHYQKIDNKAIRKQEEQIAQTKDKVASYLNKTAENCTQYKNQQRQIAELEKKFDVWRNEANNTITELKLGFDRHTQCMHGESSEPPEPNQQQKQINELKEQLENPLSGITSIWKKIENELEQDIDKSSKQLNFLQRKHFNLEEVLRELVIWLGKETGYGSVCREFKTWLEKLDSSQGSPTNKIEKKENLVEKLIKYTENWKEDTFIHYNDTSKWDDGYWIFDEFYKRIMKIKKLYSKTEKKLDSKFNLYSESQDYDLGKDLESKKEKGWRDCNECDLYGECDHQGAYQKDDKWCYEDLGKDSEECDHESHFISSMSKCPTCDEEEKLFEQYHEGFKDGMKHSNEIHEPNLPNDYRPIKEITVRRKDYKKASVGEKESGDVDQSHQKIMDGKPFHGLQETNLPNSKLPEPETLGDIFTRMAPKPKDFYLGEKGFVELKAEPEKFIENDLQIECPKCGWVSEKFKVKTKREKGLNCHGCGTTISDYKYWCVKCIKDSEKLWKKPYYDLIGGFQKVLQEAHRKLSNVRAEINLSYYLINKIEEYGEMLEK